jgi:hypothetical protein
MEKQIRFIRNRISVLISHLTEEKFEILENKNDLKHAYIIDDDDECFSVLAVVTTREKIHRFADQIMRQLKRLDININLTRLKRLVKIHITQMKNMHTRQINIQIQFYNDMITQIEHTQRYIKLLLDSKVK